VALERHGREEEAVKLDLTRTVGWFTAIYPVWLRRSGDWLGEKPWEDLWEEMRNVPRQGIGYGVLRYLVQDRVLRQQFDEAAQPKLGFNYLGQLDQSLPQAGYFIGSRESHGAQRSRADLRRWVLEITSWIFNKKLNILWAYSRSLHREETIKLLAERHLGVLHLLVREDSTHDRGSVGVATERVGTEQWDLDEMLKEVSAQFDESID
jgi:non-ribosomal peptide synthase protein (TIGR01720 family)